MALLDSVHFARMLQFALVPLAVWWLSGQVIGSWLTRWQAACLLLLGVLGYPVLFYTAGTLFPQTVIAVTLVAVLQLLQAPAASPGRSTLIGLLCGVTILLSPTALCIAPVAILAALITSRWGWKHALAIGVCCALVIATWTLRNQLVIGQPVVLSTNLALNLDNAVLDDDPMAATADRAPKSTVAYGFERLGQLVSEPDLYLQELATFFSYSNELVISTEESRLRRQIMFYTFYSLILLVLLRLALSFRQPLTRMEWLVLTLYVATALFHALVFTRIRYRVPFDLLLLLPACNTVTIAIAFWMERRRGSTTAPDADARQSTATMTSSIKRANEP